MKVLIVKKTTNYELYGASIEAKVNDGRVSMDALSRLRKAHDEHYQTLEVLRARLSAAQITFDEMIRDEKGVVALDYTAVITVGGDGTLLSTSHRLGSGLLIGVRSSVSSVGYLCAYGQDDIADLVQALQQRRFVTIEVSRLAAQVTRIDDGKIVETAPVLNDFLYTNASPAATTRYQLRFNGDEEVHRSSGLWFATGPGSTAAILAAGGEKRPQNDRLFQFRVRELYRLSLTPATIDGGIFDPDKDKIEIENRCPEAILALDGQHGSVKLGYGDMIRFKRAKPLQLVHPQKRD